MLPAMNIMFDLSVEFMKLKKFVRIILIKLVIYIYSFTENITPTWNSCKLLLDLCYIWNNIDSLKLMVNTSVYQPERLK